MKNICLSNFGPIKEANIKFGDLTILIGPQASGKSVLLQLYKLIQDEKHIRNTLNKYGFNWGYSAKEVLERFFGEGMSTLEKDTTRISIDNLLTNLGSLVPGKNEPLDPITKETIFYIPAHRVLCVHKGWPNYFSEFESSDPYVLRNFSETLRLSINFDLQEESYFPQQNRLSKILQDSINKEIYHGNKIEIEKSDRLKFVLDVNKKSLSFGQWSTGQKEFFPLLMSLYWLIPPDKDGKKNDIETVIIEEPEMGLHPRAIKTVILQVMELLSRGYKVVISTHSNVIPEFVWALNLIKQNNGSINDILSLFGIEDPAYGESLADIMSKKINTYYFKHSVDGVIAKDISSLDAFSDDKDIAEWGGISSFSSTASEIVARLVSMNGKN